MRKIEITKREEEELKQCNAVDCNIRMSSGAPNFCPDHNERNIQKMTARERVFYEKGLEDGLEINKRNYKPFRVQVLTENGTEIAFDVRPPSGRFYSEIGKKLNK